MCYTHVRTTTCTYTCKFICQDIEIVHDYYMMREVYYMYTYTFSENKKTTSSP